MKLVRGYARVPFPAAAMTPILIFFNVKGKSLEGRIGSIRKGTFPSVETQFFTRGEPRKRLPNPFRGIPDFFWPVPPKPIQMEAPNAPFVPSDARDLDGDRTSRLMFDFIGEWELFCCPK